MGFYLLKIAWMVKFRSQMENAWDVEAEGHVQA